MYNIRYHYFARQFLFVIPDNFETILLRVVSIRVPYYIS